MGVWGSGRQGRQPLAAAHPVVRLCAIQDPPPARNAAVRNHADLGRFNLWRPMIVDRMRGSNRPSAMPTGVFRELPENRRIRELQFMVPEFVDRMRGSQWMQAQPAGNSRKTAEFGNSNLWFPNSSPEPAAARACRLSLPGTPGKTAEFGSSNLWLPNSSIGCAAASGCRLSLPAASETGHCPGGK